MRGCNAKQLRLRRMTGKWFDARLPLAFICSVWALPAEARDGEVALTFDDLPDFSLSSDQAYIDHTNKALLRSLRRNHIPAIGFVNEGKLPGPGRAGRVDILRDWLKAGMDLGNHTYSHDSPNSISANAYVADIARGEKTTKALLAQRGRTIRWFRHPYLETGPTKQAKQRIDGWLSAHHYRIAPVTLEASDWMFAEPYDDALAHHDEKRRAQIKAEYLAYTDRLIGWHQKAAQALFGRQIALVMLLHDSRLNADSMDQIAGLLKRHKLRTVTLNQAMKDPAYRIPDTYVGRDGINWLERWSLSMGKTLPWDDFADPPKDIQAQYDRVDNDQ